MRHRMTIFVFTYFALFYPAFAAFSAGIPILWMLGALFFVSLTYLAIPVGTALAGLGLSRAEGAAIVLRPEGISLTGFLIVAAFYLAIAVALDLLWAKVRRREAG